VLGYKVTFSNKNSEEQLGMNKKDGRLHLKLYITMIFCVVIAIFLTSTILYVNFQSILMKHEYKAKLEKMENESARITKLSNIALSTLFQIYNDISIKKLRTFASVDAIDENTAFIQLRYYLATVPNVDSIYIYNRNNNRIYSVTNESDLVRPWRVDYDKNDGEFFDQSAVHMINNCTEYLPFIPVPRYYQVNDTYTKNVYSYMMYNTFNNSNRSDVVMLNLESEYLFQEENQDDLNGTSLVVDQNDTVIYSNSDQFLVTEKLQRYFDPERKTWKEESGYFLTEIDGNKSIVIFTSEDKHHWRYISIIDYHILLAQVNKMQAICIMITILIALVGGLVAHIFSKKLSLPIQSLSMDVKNLQSENRQLEMVSNKRKLVELLENGGQDSKGNRKTGRDLLSLVGMEFSKENKLILLCLHVDRHKTLLETNSASDIQAFKFAAFNILNELLGEKAKTYYLDMGNDKSLMILNVGTTISKEYMETQINQMQHTIMDYFSISISVIVSNTEEEPDKLYSMYENIEETLSKSIFYGEAYHKFLSEFEVKTDYHYEYPDQKEKQLMESLMLGKADEAKKIYQDIITQTYQYPIIIYKMAISRLIFAIDNVVRIIKKNSTETSFVGFFALSNLMEEVDTIEIRNEKFYELFDRIQIEIENRKNEKQEQIVGKINRIIDEKYVDDFFSLDYLADTIGMSTAYMCRIYKQYTGSTIIDVLAGKRMNKARELLISTELSVNEIASKVGYTNSTYFYRVFKKENGVTPNEFRKK
jgi:YesN/AraC family two-component response regulator